MHGSFHCEIYGLKRPWSPDNLSWKHCSKTSFSCSDRRLGVIRHAVASQRILVLHKFHAICGSRASDHIVVVWGAILTAEPRCCIFQIRWQSTEVTLKLLWILLRQICDDDEKCQVPNFLVCGTQAHWTFSHGCKLNTISPWSHLKSPGYYNRLLVVNLRQMNGLSCFLFEEASPRLKDQFALDLHPNIHFCTQNLHKKIHPIDVPQCASAHSTSLS